MIWRRLIRPALSAAILITLIPLESTAADPNLQPLVQAELKRLESASRADRTRAEQELIRLGPDILPLLPPPDLLDSAAVRVAVRRIRVRLEHDAAELSLKPSTVTLSGNLSLRQLVEEITRQSGNALSVEQLPSKLLDRRQSVDLQETTFWATISQLESIGIDVRYDPETGRLTLQPADSTRSAFASAAVRSFRLIASPLRQKEKTGESDTLVSTQIHVLSEPRLRPLFLRYQTSDFELSTGDENRTLRPFNAGASIEVPLGNGGREATIALSFASQKPLPEQAAISGKVNLLLAAREQPVSFSQLDDARRVSRRRGGVTVTVTDVGYEGSRPQQHNARVRVQVSYDLGARAFESHQTWVFHNRVYLIDPEGNEHGPDGGFSTLHQGDKTVAIEYRFRNLPDDPSSWDFVYVAPTLLINVEIPIAISELPVVQQDSTGE